MSVPVTPGAPERIIAAMWRKVAAREADPYLRMRALELAAFWDRQADRAERGE